MINILIVGLGSIGQRHLESLLKSKIKLNIYIVDIKLNEKKFLNKKRHNIFYFDKILNFKVEFLLAIISTNADVRFNVILNFLKKNKTKNILLEKICFSKPSQYLYIKKILDKTNVNTYVNYPRPSWKSYIKIKKLFHPKELKSLFFESNSWNLCSNSLHFINLFNFLTNTNSIKFKNEKIYNRYFKSKRSLFFELKGKISFVNSIDQEIILVDTFAKSHQKLSIDTVKYLIEIFERKNTVIIKNKNNSKVITKKFQVELQSNLTIKLLNKILNKEKINIPKFVDIINSDLIFLKSIYGITEKKFNKTNFLIT